MSALRKDTWEKRINTHLKDGVTAAVNNVESSNSYSQVTLYPVSGLIVITKFEMGTVIICISQTRNQRPEL